MNLFFSLEDLADFLFILLNLHERIMFSETSTLFCDCKKPEYIALFKLDEEISSCLS